MWTASVVLTGVTALVRLASDFVAQGEESQKLWQYGNEVKSGQKFADLSITVTPEELEELNAKAGDVLARAHARSAYHKKAGY